MSEALILSCEHAGSEVPGRYVELFASPRARRALESHRGYDFGALAVAEALKRHFRAPLYHSEVTRLLVDLNRSLGHRELFSEFSRMLSPEERQRLLGRHYHPHRNRVERAIRKEVERGQRTLHVAVHSFTPRLGTERRRAEVGLLYDPRRKPELDWCRRWARSLGDLEPGYQVRKNYPYRGRADGFTTYLRRKFAPRLYLGIELEVNQALVRSDPEHLAHWVVESLARIRNAR